MKSLLENKLQQTTSNTIFFFFSKFFEIMIHLKCIKHFIKHANLMMFDEVFDAFAPSLRSLTPTSNMSHGDELRSYYVVLNCSYLISAPDINLNLVEFDWNSVDSVLMPNKFIITPSKMYTFDCKKNALEDVSAASLALYAQNIASATEKNVVTKFTNRISLTRHKI